MSFWKPDPPKTNITGILQNSARNARNRSHSDARQSYQDQQAAEQRRLAQQEALISGARYQNQAEQQYRQDQDRLMNQEALISGARYQGQAEQAYKESLANNPGTPSVPRRSSSGGGSSGGGGGGVAEAAPAEPTLEERLAAINAMTGTIDPALAGMVPNQGLIELKYKQYQDDLAKNAAAQKAAQEQAKASVAGNYVASENLINQAISGSQDSLAKAAANLGVTGDWKSGPTATGLTETLNRLLGASSQNKATDLAWFEKMMGLDQSQNQNWSNLALAQKQDTLKAAQDAMRDLQANANEMAQQNALQLLQQELLTAAGGGGGGGGGGRGGGGRGRRSGGGGSGSSSNVYKSLTDAAAETSDQKNVGVQDFINSIEDPAARQWALEEWFAGTNSNNPSEVISHLLQKASQVDQADSYNSYVDTRNSLLSPLQKPLSWLGISPREHTQGSSGYVTPQNLRDLATALLQFDPTFGTQTSRSSDQKSTQTTRVPSIPVDEIWRRQSPVTPPRAPSFTPRANTTRNRNNRNAGTQRNPFQIGAVKAF